ncbi:MAG: RNA methyltransferase, partial [Cyclobacteriaceae bacterium]
MKLYRNLSEAVITALKTIFEDNKYADKVIEKTLKQNPKWGARDRRFIAETTYDIVRWYRYLLAVSGSKNDDYWSLLGTWLIWKEIELPDWDQFKNLNVNSVKGKFQKEYPLPVRESIPDWIDELGSVALGSRWEQ